MSASSREFDIEAALRSLRPSPSPGFATDLDARVAAGFPTARVELATRLSWAREWLRTVTPRQLLATAGAGALAAIVVLTAVVAISGGRPSSNSNGGESSSSGSSLLGYTNYFDGSAASSPGEAHFGGAQSSSPSSAAGSAIPRSVTAGAKQTSGPFASQANHRQIERSAQIVLGADPSQLRDDAAEVFGVVHDSDGIVLSSSIRDGGNGAASAHFELLIPSAKLDDALAGFSQIDEVRSRSDATTDVTAPAIGLSERLRDANAKIEGLLTQLAEASTDTERAAVEAQLRSERQRAATLRARLTTLQRHVHFSRVSLRIESGSGTAGSSDGSWGIGDALHDAGHILAVAAGVTLIGLAVVGPIALLCLLAWAAHRAWVRRARERALG
jgi:hypothetical protein